jgi:hypothetical protein
VVSSVSQFVCPPVFLIETEDTPEGSERVPNAPEPPAEGYLNEILF